MLLRISSYQTGEILVIPMYWNCRLSLFKMNNLSCLWINNLKMRNFKVSFSGQQLLGMILSICLCRNVHMEDYTKVPKYWSSAEEVTLLNSRNTQIGSKVFGEIVSKGNNEICLFFFLRFHSILSSKAFCQSGFILKTYSFELWIKAQSWKMLRGHWVRGD